jgi:hypothetical protein
VAVNFGRCRAELDACELRERQRVPAERRDAHLVERAHIGTRIDRRAHHDLVLLTVAVFETTRWNSCNREPHGATLRRRRRSGP